MTVVVSSWPEVGCASRLLGESDELGETMRWPWHLVVAQYERKLWDMDMINSSYTKRLRIIDPVK